jgi:redox-sensing transcriptional repressor
MARLPRPVIERLPRYYHYVQERVDHEQRTHIASGELAEVVGIDDTLVRRDLASIGVKGQPKVGYGAVDVLTTIRAALGFDLPKRAVVVGAGRLGGAVASYLGFRDFGLEVVAAVDSDPAKQGGLLATLTVRPPEDLPLLVRDQGVMLAILTLPADAAQAMAEKVVDAGVRLIWNFAPLHLDLPAAVRVRNEFLSAGLAQLSYELKQAPPGPQPGT